MSGELLNRITSDPGVMVGKPVIKGTRLTVEYILRLLAGGTELEDILREYNGLKKEDIEACFLFAANVMTDVSYMPLSSNAP